MSRPSLWDLVADMERLALPTLIVTGDEDDPCLEAGLLMKRAIARSGLVVIPQSGHTINLEEPELFNRTVANFLRTVEEGRWEPRDPNSRIGGLMGAR
jgi:pimeloyl-ACP methyl ester carboxylesterase